jgi:predicted amidohydrolase
MARNVTVSAIGCECPGGDWSNTSESVERTLQFLREQICQVLPKRPDLIVLPERCYVPREIARQLDAPFNFLTAREEKVQDLMASIAKKHKCYIAFPTYRIVGESQRYNTIHVFDRDGEIVGSYDKCRPTYIELNARILPGDQPVVLDCDFGSIGLAICFDLNFEDLLQQYVQKSPDLILFSSMYHGGLMQARWAYACRAHFIGAIGPAELPSDVLLPTGTIAASSTNYFNHVTTTINLDCQLVHLDCLFDKLSDLREHYGTGVNVFDPGLLGSVLLTAEAQGLTIQDVRDRFNLPTLDEYFERSQKSCLLASLH